MGPWRLTRTGEGNDAAGPDSAPRRAPASEPAERGPPGAGAARATADWLPSTLDPPTRVALLPDSADLHGRDLPSFRAEPIPEGERPGRVLRWNVRADTLWLVWSEPGGRAGLALFAEGDSLAGYARGVTDSLDASAPAAAWPINCATLGRERTGEVPRR